MPPDRVAPAALSSQRCGVIAEVNDKARVNHVGVTVFGNEKSLVSVKDWGFAEMVEDRVVVALKPMLPAGVVRLDTGGVDLRSFSLTQKQVQGQFDLDTSERTARSAKRRELAQKQGLTCLIIVGPQLLDSGTIDGYFYGLGLQSASLQRAYAYYSGYALLMELNPPKVLAMARGEIVRYEIPTRHLWDDPNNPLKPVLGDRSTSDFRESLGPLADLVAERVVSMFR